jgi:hypothetical protein
MRLSNLKKSALAAALLAILIGVVFVIHGLQISTWDADEWSAVASWAQAVGAIAALVFAFWYPEHRIKQEHRTGVAARLAIGQNLVVEVAEGLDVMAQCIDARQATDPAVARDQLMRWSDRISALDLQDYPVKLVYVLHNLRIKLQRVTWLIGGTALHAVAADQMRGVRAYCFEELHMFEGVARLHGVKLVLSRVYGLDKLTLNPESLRD